MNRIDEFIEKLEANKTTPNERRGFISSLTKKELIYFLKQDFNKDTQLSDLMEQLFGTRLDGFGDTKKSIDTRSDLFEEYIHQTEQLIKQFSLSELKNVLNKIRPEYITIKNMFTEHLIQLIHKTKEPIDIKKIVDFKSRVEHQQITHEDIRTSLLKMSKEEFSTLITLSNQESDPALSSLSMYDMKIEEMYEYQAEIIAEILEEYTEEEMIELVPFINTASSKIRTMFFKCLNEKKANEIFLTNAQKYSQDIYSYILTPTQSKEKDEIIITILSDPKLYSLYSEQELLYLRTLISNKEIILDENSTIINTTTEEIKQEAAKYIANLRCREKTSISRGILKKLSAAKLHDLLNEVNKGLLNIEEEEISYKDFIELMDMPIDKALVFLKRCIELTEEEKKNILNELYKDNEYSKMSISEAVNKVMNKHMKHVIASTTYKDKEFDYCYPDLLESKYMKGFFDGMLKNYTRNMFVTVTPQCMNLFLSQLIEKIKEELNIDVEKEFYVGKTITTDKLNNSVSLGSYIPSNKTIQINTNAYTEINEKTFDTKTSQVINIFLNKIYMIQTIFHELRHAYQQEIMQDIGSVRDLYFMLDQLIHHESIMGKMYYDNNYNNDSREVDANLYAIVATASLLRAEPELKKIYWSVFSKEAKELAKKRKAPQLRKMWLHQSDEQPTLTEIFNEIMGGYKIKRLSEEYPMLAIISDEGYILNEQELTDRYLAVEPALKEDELDEESYEEGQNILRFLGEYLSKIHNKKMKKKKTA